MIFTSGISVARTSTRPSLTARRHHTGSSAGKPTASTAAPRCSFGDAADARVRTSGQGGRFNSVGPGLSDEIVRSQERFESPGVRPPSVEYTVSHKTVGEVEVVDIGNFELPSPGRFHGANAVEHPGVVHVKTGHRIARPGLLGLLFDADDSVSLEDRNSEALRVGNLLENDMDPGGLPPERFTSRDDVLLNDVVT